MGKLKVKRFKKTGPAQIEIDPKRKSLTEGPKDRQGNRIEPRLKSLIDNVIVPQLVKEWMGKTREG